MLRSRWGLGRLLALTVALLVAWGPAMTATQRPALRAGSSTSSASADDRIGELAASLEYDLEGIFRFVADEVRYEPYAGILRGPVGTLDAGAGNSLDQALLLSALFDATGIRHRFARGALDEPAAARLAKSSVVDAATAKAAIEVALSGGPRPAPLEIAAPEPADPQVLADSQAAAARALETSQGQVGESVNVIANALADSGIELGGSASAALLPGAEMTGHTWVQAAVGAGWLDLDPTLGSDAAMGETLTPATETLDALPDELRHKLRFEVLLEQVRGEGLEVTPVIEYEAYADELGGRTITLAHTKPGELEGLGLAIGSVLGDAQLVYRPVLLVPDRSIVGDEVAFGAGGDGGLLGSDFFGGSPGPTGLADGEASAEWVAVTVTSPGSEPVTARRPVFDRVPAEVRYGGEPTPADVQPADLVRFTPDGDLQYVPLLGVDAFAISTGPTSLDAILARAADPSADMLAVLASSYASLRDVVAAEQAIENGAATFVDRPGVVSLSMDVAMVGDEPTLRSGLDIWHRSLAAWPTSDGTATPASARVVAGVVEHVAERRALEAGPSDGGQMTSVGVGRVFEAAAEAGVPILALQGSLPDAMSIGPRARVLIDEALDSGETVIVPAHPVDVDGQERLGWWRVDPVTGRTSDMMDDGTGSETVEYTITVRVAFCVAAIAPLVFSILWGLSQTRTENIFNATGAGVAATWYGYWSERGYRPILGCVTGRGPAI